MFDANDTPVKQKYVHFFGSQLNFSRFYLKNTKLFNVVWCEGLQFFNLNRLKLIDLPNRYNNTAGIFMCICSVRIPSLEYSLFTWNLSIFRFTLAVLLYRLGKSISFSRFKFKNCRTSKCQQILPQWCSVDSVRKDR
jgi:hypothetical protein